MNIILIGMMGSGKTTIGKELSNFLENYKLIDIDEEIEKSTQKKISDIFLQHGEKFFRILESEKIKKFCSQDNQIISTGGGAFENETNRQTMLSSGIVIYLKTSPEEIFYRIKNEKTNIGKKRPLLKNFSIERISQLIHEREKNYKKAKFIIDTTGKTPYNIAQEIIGAIND